MSGAASFPDAWAITEQPCAVPAVIGDEVDLAERLRRAGAVNGRQLGQLQARLDEARTELRDFLLGLLDVADAIDRVTDDMTVAGGTQPRAVRATGRKLQQVLRRQGVQRAEMVGRVLDPALADATDSEPDPTVPEETVLRELEAAYRWGGDVLRRGRVVVSTQSTRPGE